MKTARERRAAGEDPFCSCSGCVANACDDLRVRGVGGSWYGEEFVRVRLAALLRALVIAALLDPATWARPAGWHL